MPRMQPGDQLYGTGHSDVSVLSKDNPHEYDFKAGVELEDHRRPAAEVGGQ